MWLNKPSPVRRKHLPRQPKTHSSRHPVVRGRVDLSTGKLKDNLHTILSTTAVQRQHAASFAASGRITSDGTVRAVGTVGAVGAVGALAEFAS